MVLYGDNRIAATIGCPIHEPIYSIISLCTPCGCQTLSRLRRFSQTVPLECLYHGIAFKKPGADTPGKRDDLDYDIGNMEATDNHQVNMEVGWFLRRIGSCVRSLKLIKRLIFFVLLEIIHSFLLTTCLNFLQRIQMWVLS